MGGACRAYGGEENCIQGFAGGNLKEIEHLGDTGLDGRIILRWIFRKCDVTGTCECCNEPSVSLK